MTKYYIQFIYPFDSSSPNGFIIADTEFAIAKNKNIDAITYYHYSWGYESYYDKTEELKPIHLFESKKEAERIFKLVLKTKAKVQNVVFLKEHIDPTNQLPLFKN
jgi:hypothetical protein